jgi:hypothetical protein
MTSPSTPNESDKYRPQELNFAEERSVGKALFHALEGFRDTSLWLLLEYDADVSAWYLLRGSTTEDGHPIYRVCSGTNGLVRALDRLANEEVSETTELQAALVMRALHKALTGLDQMDEER